MTRRISLEDFDDGVPEKVPVQETATAPSPDFDSVDLKLKAFEEGYKSGWDDCHAENVKSEQAIASDLARSLSELEMTYHQARRDVLTAIRPVIDTMVGQLLPRIANDSLCAMVVQELLPHLENATELEPELQCSPDAEPVLQKLLSDREGISVKITPEPSFSGAQVALRLGAEARNIELSVAIEQISQELSEFTERLIADLPVKQRG